MKIRTIIALAAVIGTLILVPLASAGGPNGIGSPTLRVVNGGTASSATIFADAITNGGSAGNGAIGWDIYLTVPDTIGLADFSLTADPAWTSICPGTFLLNKVGQQSTVVGHNAFLVSGVCLVQQTQVVTGSNIPVVTLNFATSCSTTGAFNLNLDTGPFDDSTDMFDLMGDVYIFPSTSLTDGGNLCGDPTAVTMTGLDAASSSAAPFAAAAWPLLAGAAAVAAGGAYALLRRKS